MPLLKAESILSNDNAIPYNTVESVYYIPATIRKYEEISPQILLLRAVSGCDTVAYTYRFGIYIVNLWH